MRGQIALSFAALAIVAPANIACWADGPKADEPRYEMYAGAGYDGRTANLTSSFVWSVFGPVTESGIRLKFDGLGDLYGETAAPMASSSFIAGGLKEVADLMIGYQFAYGPAWVKLYAGAAYEAKIERGTAFETVEVSTQEKNWGAAAALQSYWQMSSRVWASLNVTWLQPDNSTSVYSRAAYEIYRSEGGLKISAGAEASFTHSSERSFWKGKAFDLYKDYFQGGALLNLRYGANDLSLSGGLAQSSDETVSRPYASISYGRQF